MKEVEKYGIETPGQEWDGQIIAGGASPERKVRTPHGNVAGNARPPQGEDKCNRKDVRGGKLPAVVKSGKLYVVQAQIGQGPMTASQILAGRVLEALGN